MSVVGRLWYSLADGYATTLVAIAPCQYHIGHAAATHTGGRRTLHVVLLPWYRVSTKYGMLLRTRAGVGRYLCSAPSDFFLSSHA
eukprot:2498032-Rhodomonas_salina.2